MASKKKDLNKELPIIQQTYDLILWYVPLLNRLPREHRFLLGDRIASCLYELLGELIECRYATEKVVLLKGLNVRLDVLRYRTRLLRDFALFDVRRYEHASRLIQQIGLGLGGWIKQQEARL